MLWSFKLHLTLTFVILLTFCHHLVQSQHPVIQFSQNSYYGKLKEKQPIGTEAVLVQASYYTVSGEHRTDGTFQLFNNDDGKFFKVTTHSNNSISTGSVESAVSIDRNTANKTQFSFNIWYATPDNSSSNAGVTVDLIST